MLIRERQPHTLRRQRSSASSSPQAFPTELVGNLFASAAQRAGGSRVAVGRGF